jgi:hypothetical protein
MPSNERKHITPAVAASFASGQGGSHEFRWIAKEGHAAWVEARTAIFADEKGRLIEVRGVTLDISERKRVEETVQQREAQLRPAQKWKRSQDLSRWDCPKPICKTPSGRVFGRKPWPAASKLKTRLTSV